MARIPRRFLLSDLGTFHISWQCHNKAWLLRFPWAKELLYDLMWRYKKQYGIKIYSYCFMSSHPHFAGHCESQVALSAYFRVVNSLFAKQVNQRLNRRGQLIMDRFFSREIQNDQHLLTTLIYIDLNPVRARVVVHPSEYRHSSFAYYAFGHADPLIDPAPSYLALGNSPEERQRIYREKVTEVMGDQRHKEFTQGYFIGDPSWVIARADKLKSALDSYRRRLASRQTGWRRVKL